MKFTHFFAVTILLGGTGWTVAQTPPPVAQQDQAPVARIQTVAANAQNNARSIPDTLAEVNGVKITRNEILTEAFRQHHEKVLDARIRLLLIDMECQRQNIQVSNQEIDEEIQRMARALNISTEDWMDMILRENGFTADIYRHDIVRPLIQLRKLAGVRIQVTQDELEKAFQAEFGPSVSLRQIVHNSRSEIERIRAAVVANPSSFAAEARNHSTDPASAAYGGMIRRIRRYTTNDQIENAVFNLKPDEISQIVEWPQGNFIMFQCVEHYPATNVDIVEANKYLELKIRDHKLQRVSGEVYTDIQDNARIQVIMTDRNLSQQHPNLAAVVNGVEMTRRDVAEHCFKMFGEIVLAERISIEILNQECQKRNITVTDADINAEILDRASKEMRHLEDGSHVTEWLELQARSQKTTVTAFRNNTMRPLAMLKKLTESGVQVTEEDIQKGFEANYGPRARCLAIFFNNMRQAQQVWDQVRRVPNQEYFGDLAAKYSIHGPSKANRGEIKPIQKYGGMPLLEQKAFELQPGAISEVIQIGPEEFVILFGLGQTTPVVRNIADVRELLIEDIHERKSRLAMQIYLEDLLARSTVTNYLTGEQRIARQPATDAPLQR